MKYIESYPVDKLHEADYNPRSISDSMFVKLCESIQRFGVCIPLIINKSGTLIAGHQRTKAIKLCNIKNVPVYVSEHKVAIHDEIRFNMLHNKIDGHNAEVYIIGRHVAHTFVHIAPNNIRVQQNRNTIQITENANLLCKYGEFGGCVADVGSGRVIYGQMYATACAQCGIQCLVYYIDSESAYDFESILLSDYGEYDFSHLNIKAYSQTYCQMHRKSTQRGSCLYEQHVIPSLRYDLAYIDFGAGECAYASSLKRKGYNFTWYEPFYKKGTGDLNISATVRMIKSIEEKIKMRGELFDVCILDSVLNSSTSLEYEHCIMLTVNSLLKGNGVLYCTTRNALQLQEPLRKKVVQKTKRRNVFYADKNNYTASFNSGTWTMQKFHTREQFLALLNRYFDKIELLKSDSPNSIFTAKCMCPKPFPISEMERVLNIEFNMEYPGGVYHDQHHSLVNLILSLHQTN